MVAVFGMVKFVRGMHRIKPQMKSAQLYRLRMQPLHCIAAQRGHLKIESHVLYMLRYASVRCKRRVYNDLILCPLANPIQLTWSNQYACLPATAVTNLLPAACATDMVAVATCYHVCRTKSNELPILFHPLPCQTSPFA